MARRRAASSVTVALGPIVLVFANGCGAAPADTSFDPSRAARPPVSAPAPEPELALGIAVLGMTPRPGEWFDVCVSDSARLVELFEGETPRSPERTALYFDLLAKLSALRVNGTSIDDAHVEPISRDTPSFDELNTQCHDLLAPNLAVTANGCDGAPGAPCAADASPATLAARTRRTVGDRMLDATPRPGAWFDGCEHLSRQLVNGYERADRERAASPRNRAHYIALLADFTAIRVRALALDAAPGEPVDEAVMKQSRIEIGVACSELLDRAVDAYEPRWCGNRP